MVDGVEGPWTAEDIPSIDTVFIRIHVSQIEFGQPKPGFFRNRVDPEHPGKEPGMSTNWSRYATAADARARAKAPEANGVIALNVGRIRQIPQQRVEHTPIFWATKDPRNNRSHADIFGPKVPKEATTLDQRVLVQRVRFDFLEIFEWVIPLPNPE